MRLSSARADRQHRPSPGIRRSARTWALTFVAASLLLGAPVGPPAAAEPTGRQEATEPAPRDATEPAPRDATEPAPRDATEPAPRDATEPSSQRGRGENDPGKADEPAPRQSTAQRDRRARGPSFAPVDPPHGRVTSAFGYRMSARSRRRRFHAGMDFEAPRGTAVRTVRDGVVEAVPRSSERGTGFGGYGNAVIVHHPEERIWVLYAHLDSVRVRPGQQVQAGDVLGRSGRTSNRRFPRMAPHLHLEIRRAAADGGSPFPGPYRRNNRNPRCWFAAHGLHYDDAGHLQPRPTEGHARCVDRPRRTTRASSQRATRAPSQRATRSSSQRATRASSQRATRAPSQRATRSSSRNR